ncbi:hypothetical protein U9M48_040611 [Paspalum notatum var. saurae]|uniref:NAD-dependent epimerase/dehydratase domain-containing protein n=1 Tax=Paspalum notatum var. saurae TaxID=547442 RepID=A0AAQ3USQ5_PASNO
MAPQPRSSSPAPAPTTASASTPTVAIPVRGLNCRLCAHGHGPQPWRRPAPSVPLVAVLAAASTAALAPVVAIPDRGEARRDESWLPPAREDGSRAQEEPSSEAGAEAPRGGSAARGRRPKGRRRDDRRRRVSSAAAAAVAQPGNGQTVCVTGAAGYIASWLVKLLLKKGYTVKGTVRNPGMHTTYTSRCCYDPKNAHLKVKALEGAAERLILCKADLLDYHAICRAVQGCRAVFHTASPVTDDPVSTTTYRHQSAHPSISVRVWQPRAPTPTRRHYFPVNFRFTPSCRRDASASSPPARFLGPTRTPPSPATSTPVASSSEPNLGSEEERRGRRRWAHQARPHWRYCQRPPTGGAWGDQRREKRGETAHRLQKRGDLPDELGMGLLGSDSG